MLGRDGRGTAVVAIALAVALVAGCTGDKTESPAPGTTVASTAVTPSQAPSSSMTSGTSASARSAGSSASPSVTADPALVADAQKVNQKQWEVQTALFNIGGLPPGGKPPKELTEVMMDEGLTMTMQAMHEAFKLGRKRASGAPSMRKVRITNEWDLEGSLIALESCRDGRDVTYEDASGTSQRGVLILHTAFFKRDNQGKLKMNSWAGEEVKSCPF